MGGTCGNNLHPSTLSVMSNTATSREETQIHKYIT